MVAGERCRSSICGCSMAIPVALSVRSCLDLCAAHRTSSGGVAGYPSFGTEVELALEPGTDLCSLLGSLSRRF